MPHPEYKQLQLHIEFACLAKEVLKNKIQQDIKEYFLKPTCHSNLQIRKQY